MSAGVQHRVVRTWRMSSEPKLCEGAVGVGGPKRGAPKYCVVLDTSLPPGERVVYAAREPGLTKANRAECLGFLMGAVAALAATRG